MLLEFHMIIDKQKEVLIIVFIPVLINTILNLISIVQYSINYKLLSTIMLSSRKGSGSILLIQHSEI